MKVALSLEVTDDQRRELASRIAGKSVARLATRDEVREFVSGTVESLSIATSQEVFVDADATPQRDVRQSTRTQPDVPSHHNHDKSVARRDTFTGAEHAEAERLRREGKCESYIRGWIAAGRKS